MNAPEQLGDQDRAILRAANRVGWLQWQGCGRGGNAVLVRVGGRDAILTNAHQIFDSKTGKTLGRCQNAAETRGRFYPNASYRDLGNTFRPRAWEARLPVGVTMDSPLSGKKAQTSFPLQHDYLLMFLEVDISNREAPDGQIRGYVPFSSNPIGADVPGYIVGFDPRFDQDHGGQAMSYQACRFSIKTRLVIDHTCDATKGSSSSLLAVFENGELRLRGVNTAVRLPIGTTAPTTENRSEWNIGIPAETFLTHWKSLSVEYGE